MRLRRPFLLAILTGALVAAGAHAGTPTGLRLTGGAGQSNTTGSPGYYGFGGVLDSPVAPVCRVGVAFDYRRLLPRSGTLLLAGTSANLDGGSDFGALMAALELRAPIRGHSSPFLRSGFGFGYLRAGDARRWDNTVPEGRSEVVPGPRRFGLTARSAVGFGRIPSQGLGWEMGLEMLQFLSPDAGFHTVGLSMGIVY